MIRACAAVTADYVNYTSIYERSGFGVLVYYLANKEAQLEAPQASVDEAQAPPVGSQD